MTNNYQQTAIDFLKKYGIKFSVKFLNYGRHFSDDTERRNIYRCTFSRNGKRFSVRFGQSIVDTNAGVEPTAYDLLSCIEKYDPYTFEDFCSNYGYDNDSRKAEKIFRAVMREYKKVSAFFTAEELEELQEIN